MTEQELIQENEKLTARLKKAVEVFNEQKATISRLTEEVESLKNKAAEAEKHDDEFFDQVNEIEELKNKVKNLDDENSTLCNNLNDLIKERDETKKRLEKAAAEYKKLKDEYDSLEKEKNSISEKDIKLEDVLKKVRNVVNF